MQESTLKKELLQLGKDRSIWQSPMSGRYASQEMKELFSDNRKFTTWRKLWVALAEAEQELGLPITDEQIREMKLHVNNINYGAADMKEREVRHDVMAHVYAYGLMCPKADGIIHWGATSCYVTDNTDLLLIQEGLRLIYLKLLTVIENLADFAEKYKAVPTLGLTHGQPAALVTVGKRAALWLQNFMVNLQELSYVQEQVRLLGCRGATGTSDTFMDLFEGDEEKVKRLDDLIAEKMGFPHIDEVGIHNNRIWAVSGQTYPRIFDVTVLNCLANITVSAYKMAEDIRILQHDKEMEEPFEQKQIGSSAMPYKRNPMRSERICSLARYVQNEARNAYDTANVQWFERTLDDSANRRNSIPEGFLGTDAVLILCANVTKGLVVNEVVIRKHLNEELPFMVVERILMRAVKNGGNRQELHERIRKYAMKAAYNVKQRGWKNNLISMILKDEKFGALITREEIEDLMEPQKLIGRAPGQVEDYLKNTVRPLLNSRKHLLAEKMDMEVSV